MADNFKKKSLTENWEDGLRDVENFYAGPSSPDQKLAFAVSRGDALPAAEYIAAGADVNQVHRDLPLIHEAAGRGYRVLVDALLASGRCDLTVRDFAGRLASEVADSAAHDFDLADRLAAEEVYQFREKNMDPRSPDNPDFGNWNWH